MRSNLRSVVAVLCLAAVLVPSLSFATVITVRSDATGDYSTVAAAVAASIDGDSIEVGPGTYIEPGVTCTHALTIYSTDSAAATTLDGNLTNRILRFEGSGAVARLEGLRFTRGFGAFGILTSYGGASVDVEECVFEGNQDTPVMMYLGSSGHFLHTSFINNLSLTGGPGAVYISRTGSQGTFVECEFTGNQTDVYGGAASIVIEAHGTFEECTFSDNYAEVHAGAVNVGETASADLADCLLEGNRAGAGTIVYYFRASGSVTGCTFFRNEGIDVTHGALVIQETQTAVAERNIFFGEINGYGLEYIWDVVPHACNVFWNNDAGSIGGASLAPTDVEADPVFCDAEGGDFHVSTLGPAAPAQSACGQLVGAFPPACDVEPPQPPSDAPVITSVEDVPNDQGRAVRIKWQRSAQDASATDYTITGYAIYRYEGLLEEGMLYLAPPPPTVRDRNVAIEGWDYVATVPARGDDIYQTVAPTLCDWTKKNYCGSAFFVSALTPDPLTFFDSEPDTGYSVDNLPPGPPLNLSVAYAAAGGVNLSWTAPEDDDVVGYRVYRGSTPDFAAGPSLLAAETQETQWADAVAGYYYKVTAVDKGDNESPAADPSTTTEAGNVPAAYRLGQNEPNPFNPSTVIPYDVGASGGRVTLRVYDVSGGLVRTLVDGVKAQGGKTAFWNGEDERGRRVASGTYFYRLTAPGYEKTLKMTIIK